MKKRIEYLDIVKVIAIFLVVFCHFVLLSESIPSNLFMSACWSGVPMFFMVNGALLFTRPLNLKKHIYKTLTIYLVLVIWRLIYLLSIGAINHVPVSGFGKMSCSFTCSPSEIWKESGRGICGSLRRFWPFMCCFLCSGSASIFRSEES